LTCSCWADAPSFCEGISRSPFAKDAVYIIYEEIFTFEDEGKVFYLSRHPERQANKAKDYLLDLNFGFTD